MKLTHITNTEWLERRKIQWERVLIYEKSNDVASKKEQSAFSEYFFSGDFEKLIKKTGKVSTTDALRYYPANNFEQFQYINKKVWEYGLNTMSERALKRKDTNFFNKLTFITSIDITASYIPQNLLNEIFTWVFGDIYEAERSIDIGLEWFPTSSIDAMGLGYSTLFNILYKYLTSDNGAESYPYIPDRIDYILSAVPYFNAKYFSVQLADKKDEINHGNQLFIRRFLLYILGHGVRSEKHNDRELESYIKEWISNKENGMHEEFFELVDFLKEHKRAALKPLKK